MSSEKETLQVGDDTKKFLVYGIKKHIEIEFPKLHDRVVVLEQQQRESNKIEAKVMMLEQKFTIVNAKVDGLSIKVEQFFNEMRDEFREFTDATRSINTSFVRWMIGTVLLSLIFGLFCQYKAFEDVRECIYDLEKKVLIMQHDNRTNKQKGQTQ